MDQDHGLTTCSVYLVSIAIANRVKDKFYAEDLPNLEDVRGVALSLHLAD